MRNHEIDRRIHFILQILLFLLCLFFFPFSFNVIPFIEGKLTVTHYELTLKSLSSKGYSCQNDVYFTG